MPKLNRRQMFWLCGAGGAAWAGWEIFKPIQIIPMDMKVQLLQPSRDFFNDNHLDPTRYLYDNESGLPLPHYQTGTFYYEPEMRKQMIL